MFITMSVIICLGVCGDGSVVCVYLYVCFVVKDERVTEKIALTSESARCILCVFEQQLETAVWQFQPPCWTKTKPQSSSNNNIWACLTAWINKQALWTLIPPHSISLTPSRPVPPCHSEGCRLLVLDWHISTDSVHPINYQTLSH